MPEVRFPPAPQQVGGKEVAESAVQRAVRAETTLAHVRIYVESARAEGVRHWVLDELERILGNAPLSGGETTPPPSLPQKEDVFRGGTG